MPAPSTLPPILKYLRAREHLDALNAQMTAFRVARNHESTTVRQPDIEQDAQGRTWRIMRSPPVPKPPDWWALAVGDAMHNARAALDHLVYQLALANGHTNPKGTSFPLWPEAPNSAKAEATLNSGIKLLRDEHRDLVVQLQPFEAPDTPRSRGLSWLAYADNADKHRLLLATDSVIAAPEKHTDLSAIPDLIESVWASGPLSPDGYERGAELMRYRSVGNRNLDFEMTVQIELKFGDPGRTFPEILEVLDIVREVAKMFQQAFPLRPFVREL